MRDGSEYRYRISGFLASAASSTKVEIIEFEQLSGGSVQENFKVVAYFSDGPFSGLQILVLRVSPAQGLRESASRTDEFNIQRLAFAENICVPEPLWLCEDENLIGRTFYFMRLVPGTASASKIVEYCARDNIGDSLAIQLGTELARIHEITSEIPKTKFLGSPVVNPAKNCITKLKKSLAKVPTPQPVLELGLRWLENTMPNRKEVVLTHRDFRTGNYMVSDGQLAVILDWEFSGWSDPYEDIAWFCARCWRYGRIDLEAGGIANRKIFYQAYTEQSGRTLDPERIFWWEVLAQIRWAVIAYQQGERFDIEGQSSLDLALTSRRAAEISFELLAMIAPSELSNTVFC